MKKHILKICIATTVRVFVMLSLICCTNSNNLNPVILIPGNGGNQLEAKLTKQYKPSTLICDSWYPPFKKKNGWFRLWFDSSVLLAPFTKCFASRMTLYYDQQLDDYFNAPGVHTRVPLFGSTSSLLYLNPRLK
jgi:lysophospholipase-3